MRYIKYGIGALILIALHTNCASIVSKTNYEVRINSVPRDATATIFNRDGKEIFTGKTPFQVVLSPKAGYFKRAIYTVEFNKEGFAKKSIVVSSGVNGWYFGNLLLGGLIGMLIIDPLTGAMYRIEDVDISEALTALTANEDNKEKTLMIYNLADIPASLKDKLVLIKTVD